MRSCCETPEQGWDVHEDGQQEEDVGEELRESENRKPQCYCHFNHLPHLDVFGAVLWFGLPLSSSECTLCSHSGELSACCCTAAQQKESIYAACLSEKLMGAKQLIWVPGRGK